MNFSRRLLLFVLATTLLGACSQPAAQPDQPTAAPIAPAAQPVATAAGAYPGPDSVTSAYPGPGGAPVEPTVDSNPIVVPQPASADVGVTTGTLYRLDEGKRVPMSGALLYLGTLLKNSEGAEAMVQLDRTIAPKAITNGLGQFVFTDLPPGRYGLMFDAIEGVLLLNDPDDSSDMIIEVTGGQINDLGELAYLLPDLD